MSARLATLALVAAALPAAAGAYVRSVDTDTGACLYWKPRSVTYRINPTRAGTSPSCGPLSTTDSAAAAAIEHGFTAWAGAQQACTDLALVRGPDTSAVKIGYAQGGTNENLIVFRKGWCSNNDAAKADPCWTNPSVRCSDTFGCFENTGSLAGTSIIALTTTTYSTASGEIVDADMEFVDWTGQGSGTGITGTRPQGWYFTCHAPKVPADACTSYGEADCDSMDLENTATHEAGHFIGFAHNQADLESTMAPTAAVGEVKKRSLTADDVAGVCAVYPKGGKTLVCVEAKKSSSGGCGTGAAGPLALLALGALAARRRAHRTRTAA